MVKEGISMETPTLMVSIEISRTRPYSSKIKCNLSVNFEPSNLQVPSVDPLPRSDMNLRAVVNYTPRSDMNLRAVVNYTHT